MSTVFVPNKKKCMDVECCGPRRSVETFPWLPDPVLMTADHNHYQTLEQILVGQLDTTDKDRPSASNRTVAAVAEELQGVKNSVLNAQNVRCTVECYECRKPRCIYATKKLSTIESRGLNRLLEKSDYTCGALLAPEGDVLHGTVFVRLQICSNSPVEWAYYASSCNIRKDICSHVEENFQRNQELLKDLRVVLQCCNQCQRNGHQILNRRPVKK